MSTDTVTRLLERHRAGDAAALDELMRLVYAELRRLAAWRMRGERADHTLQPTELVHEAFLRLAGDGETAWRSRAHFFAVASRVMRHVLVDHARARASEKRGGSRTIVALEDAAVAAETRDVDVLAVHEALDRLAAADPRLVEIVELRYFGGLTVPEVAEVTGISRATVEREWAAARAWLRTELG